MSIYWADISNELAFLVPSQGLEDDQQIKNLNIQSQAANNPSTCSQSATTINSSLGSSAISSNYEDKTYQKNSQNANSNLINSSEQRSMSSYSDDTISSASHNLSENSSQLRNAINNNSSSINNSNNLTAPADLSQRKKNRQTMHANIGCDIKILIIWLENSEDEFSLPLSK